MLCRGLLYKNPCYWFIERVSQWVILFLCGFMPLPSPNGKRYRNQSKRTLREALSGKKFLQFFQSSKGLDPPPCPVFLEFFKDFFKTILKTTKVPPNVLILIVIPYFLWKTSKLNKKKKIVIFLEFGPPSLTRKSPNSSRKVHQKFGFGWDPPPPPESHNFQTQTTIKGSFQNFQTQTIIKGSCPNPNF